MALPGGLAADLGECQLQELYRGAETLTLTDHIHNRWLRLRSYVRDHAREVARRLGLRLPPASTGAGLALAWRLAADEPLKAGDIVEVRPLAEIESTLDQHGRCGGLRFMKAMGEFCGQRFVVLTPVRRIFDERQWRMVRLRRVVLLRDVVCEGHYLVEREGCDRRCFFFWKDQWLRKV
jgi:hypothetical protein